MFFIKNIVKSENILCTGSHKFSRYIWFQREFFLKRSLTYLYWTKYNDFNLSHLNVQKHASFKNGVYSVNILNTSSNKIFNELRPMGEEF